MFCRLTISTEIGACHIYLDRNMPYTKVCRPDTIAIGLIHYITYGLIFCSTPFIICTYLLGNIGNAHTIQPPIGGSHYKLWIYNWFELLLLIFCKRRVRMMGVQAQLSLKFHLRIIGSMRLLTISFSAWVSWNCVERQTTTTQWSILRLLHFHRNPTTYMFISSKRKAGK